MSLDLGTGDGRLPYTLGREAPHRLFIGIDANAAGLRRYSGRAVRQRLANVIFVRASLEALPSELSGVADQITAKSRARANCAPPDRGSTSSGGRRA